MSNAPYIIENIFELDGTLVFCDDSDIQGQPNPDFAPDVRALFAVVMSTANYCHEHFSALTQVLQGRELHAKDIVHGQADWKNTSISDRLEVIRIGAEVLQLIVRKIYFCRIPPSQFKELCQKAKIKGPVNTGFKGGLRKVFLRLLIKKLTTFTGPVTLVVAQGTKNNKPKFDTVYFDTAYSDKSLNGGSPIIASSADIIGLQLADLTAWSIFRFIRHRPNFESKKLELFDKAACKLVSNLPTKAEDLLG